MTKEEKKMIRDNREYRNMPMPRLEKRDGEGGESFIVEGYASTFDKYELFEMDGIKYFEQIDKDAFKDCDMSDVVFLKDHKGTVFARTKNGTIELKIDKKGLNTRTDLSKTSSARQMFEEIAADMYTQMSFSFIVDDDEYDQRTHTRIIRHIKKLFDISAVSFPANSFTDIGVATRSRFEGFIEAEQLELAEREKQLALAKAKYHYFGGK